MNIRGVVVHGKKQGRKLGYPTANLHYQSDQTLENGVWTCRVVINGQDYRGLAVVGMWNLRSGEPSAEVHVLDFDEDIYGQTIDVTLQEHLRPLEKFETVEQLKGQIEKDVRRAKCKF